MFLDFPEQDPGISFSTLICVGSDPRNIYRNLHGENYGTSGVKEFKRMFLSMICMLFK